MMQSADKVWRNMYIIADFSRECASEKMGYPKKIRTKVGGLVYFLAHPVEIRMLTTILFFLHIVLNEHSNSCSVSK